MNLSSFGRKRFWHRFKWRVVVDGGERPSGGETYGIYVSAARGEKAIEKSRFREGLHKRRGIRIQSRLERHEKGRVSYIYLMQPFFSTRIPRIPFIPKSPTQTLSTGSRKRRRKRFLLTNWPLSSVLSEEALLWSDRGSAVQLLASLFLPVTLKTCNSKLFSDNIFLYVLSKP